MNDTSDLAEWLAGGQFDPEHEFNSKRRSDSELDKLGHRVNKIKTVDVNAEYR